MCSLVRSRGAQEFKDTVREKYVSEVSRMLKDGWHEEGLVEEQ